VIPHKNPGWIDFFTDEIIVLEDVLTRIEYDPNSPIKAGDFVVYVPAWYSESHPGDECSGAINFYNHAHDEHIYGGTVLDDNGDLYIEVSLPMTTETDEPLTTDTADSVLGSTYVMCWVRRGTSNHVHKPKLTNPPIASLAGPEPVQRAPPQAPGLDPGWRRLCVRRRRH
jgi:hypothetical protein